MNRALISMIIHSVIVMALIGFSRAYATTGEADGHSFFGLESGWDYSSRFSTLGMHMAVYLPQDREKLIIMLRDSLDRLRGARRPVLLERLNHRTNELWIIESNTVEVPTVRFQKSGIGIKNGKIICNIWAALITVPKGWKGRSLTPAEQDLLDRAVLNASPHIVARARALSLDNQWITFKDFVRQWQTHLTFEVYEKYGHQINDETVSQVYQDLARAENEGSDEEFVAPSKSQLKTFAKQIRQKIEQEHLANQAQAAQQLRPSQMMCESIFEPLTLGHD